MRYRGSIAIRNMMSKEIEELAGHCKPVCEQEEIQAKKKLTFFTFRRSRQNLYFLFWWLVNIFMVFGGFLDFGYDEAHST